MNIRIFDSINIPAPKRQIYTRLGYSSDTTQVTQKQKSTFEQYIAEAAGIIDLKGVCLRIPIIKTASPRIMLANDIIFESESLIKLLSNCEEALLMGATAGSNIVNAIKEGSAGKDVTRAVVFDAVASESVDEALSWIMNLINREISREGKHLTKTRFSAGYGDFSLSNQKIICGALGFEKLGVSLTESYILVPEKSVTAVAGIKSTS